MSTVNEIRSSREIFAELYEEYLPKVFRYVRYRINEHQVAEDLTSTVFERALTNFDKYSSDKASFSTWVFSIARNVVIDHYRVRGRRRTISLDDAPEIASGELPPVDRLEQKEERQKLWENLSRLSPEEREIIALKFGSELNNRQIARTLGLSESNVGTKLYRAVRKLRDSFQGADND